MQLQKLPEPMVQIDDDFIDFQHYWRVVRQSWKGILGLCLIVGMVATLWVMRIQPVYRATTTIMVESQTPSPVSIQEMYAFQRNNYQYLQTQFQIIKNRDIAARAADKLKLWEDQKFAPLAVDAQPEENAGIKSWLNSLGGRSPSQPAAPVDPEERIRAAVTGRILGPMTVEPVEYTQLVRVNYDSTNRVFAARVVNAMAEAFIESQIEAKLESTQEAGAWLSSRLDDLKANLEASEQALQDFRDQEDLLQLAGGASLDERELDDLSTRLNEAQRSRVESENVYREVTQAADLSVLDLMSIPGVANYPLVVNLAQSLTEAQQEVAGLRKRYGPEHPRMISAIVREQSVRQEFDKQIQQVADSLRKEYLLAKKAEDQLAAELAEVKQDVASQNRKEFQLRELERKVEADQRLYEMFFTRAKENSEAMSFQSAHARIVEKAVPPLSPIRPDKRRLVSLAVMMAALVGIGLAILRDFLDNTLRSPDDVADRLGAPLLGTLPDIKQKKSESSGPYLGYLEDTRSSFAEAVRTLRTGLALSGLETPHKVTIVTSTTPSEGKSTVAINLAAALAQMEDVLLIDADLRRPSVAKAFQLSSDAPGLSNVLAQSDELDNCVHTTDAGFDVLPAGIVPTNPQEMISTARFKALVKDLSRKYDRVIIDSAPLNVVSDSLILATLADSLVYVARAEATPHRLAKKSIDVIKHSNLPLTGVVLNRLDTKRQSSYGKGEHYNNYYAYEQD